MAAGFKHRILVVDDEESILRTSREVLAGQGYEVRTAHDGFEALIELRGALPDVIVTDLSMPNMSGFELLSVIRKRFPQIAVIAISGAYAGGNGGLIADAFFAKGEFEPNELFRKIAALIAGGPLRPGTLPQGRAPVWIPLNADGFYIVTCNDCLRSSPVPAGKSDTDLRHSALFAAQNSRSSPIPNFSLRTARPGTCPVSPLYGQAGEYSSSGAPRSAWHIKIRRRMDRTTNR